MSKGHLTHSVFFTLKDPSDENIQKLVDDCYQYLSSGEGLISLHAGARIPDLDRPVNDDQFHVALIVILESREAHDAYQEMADHITFIERNKESWASVRVFDATS
ncbi:Dabb family protein [Mariniblastus fucicola]|uniref:Stress responsive A/B Barrel Domain protein n=1 Tax=Mariniblastus fucicola TaxID=980251 RepID=A0A5B9PAK8_9BACT|nr:Dabb family protein [Mariniblastus fucicola]QEG23807.1 Stress responsive A/B Barrel Domain protein [Mariniblastus fucicola]